MDAAIRMQHVARTFGAVRAVDDLTLDVPAGIVFGYLGPNGSGKTTTIRLLLGLLAPTAGQAEVLGYDTVRRGDAIRAACGALLEHPGLYERLSAEDNLEFYARAWRLPASARRARARELLTHLELWDRRREPVGTWSRGMKQKLAVARTLLHRPRLVFLDEPTAGLDPLAAVALRQDLAALVQREGVTVFLTTHNLTDAEKLCARVAVIRQGRLLAVGHPDELRALNGGGMHVAIHGRGLDERMLDLLRVRPEVAAATRANSHFELDLRPGADVAPLVSLLVGAGAQIEEVRRGRASLEDVFVELVDDERQN